MTLSTNLDIRSYAAARNVKLYEIAEKLGMSPAAFSTAYMRNEQTKLTKESLKRIIREIDEEKKGGKNEEVQAE